MLFASVSFVFWQYLTRFRIGYGVTEWGVSLIPMMLAFSPASKRPSLAAPIMLTYLGDISFSLYLWHGLVQGVMPYPFVRAGHGDMTIGSPFLFLTTATAILVAATHRHLPGSSHATSTDRRRFPRHFPSGLSAEIGRLRARRSSMV
jgi:exopolysaccharide production protein ExoZ